MIHNPPAQTCYVNQNLQTPTMAMMMMMMKTTHWEVQYARFFNFPPFSLSSTPDSASATKPSSLLRPIYPRKKRRVKGNWVPSISTNASLSILFHHHSVLEPTLIVSSLNSVYEEHYVTKLHFTWPQVSCLSECAVRGSRVIFASYRDNMHQIQKFAVRFCSSAESEEFMESLKVLKEAGKVDCPSGVTPITFRQRVEEISNYVNPSMGCTTTPQWQPTIIKQEQVPQSCSQQAMLSHAAEGLDAALPPSFTALLLESCTEIHPGVSEAPSELNLNNFLQAGGMTDDAFVEMLDKIDSIIIGLGGDLSL